MIQMPPELSAARPSLRVGYLSYRVRNNTGAYCLPLRRMAGAASHRDPSTQQHTEGTHKLLKACGTAPSRYRPSYDALSRRQLAAKPLVSVNPVVDIGNYISLRYGVCIGSYDANCIQGSISFAWVVRTRSTGVSPTRR
ncbi:hypothetical protein HAQ06_06955 [Pseudomonas sp. C2L12B]|nr:hypothetical protein [Pseudomonas typographi]